MERLTALNEELRELINQEREANNDEVARIEKQHSLKVKKIDTRTVILKNKLMSLSNMMGVYIS